MNFLPHDANADAAADDDSLEIRQSATGTYYVHTMCYLKGVPNECKLVMLYCRLCEYAL